MQVLPYISLIRINETNPEKEKKNKNQKFPFHSETRPDPKWLMQLGLETLVLKGLPALESFHFPREVKNGLALQLSLPCISIARLTSDPMERRIADEHDPTHHPLGNTNKTFTLLSRRDNKQNETLQLGDSRQGEHKAGDFDPKNLPR